MYSVSKSQIAVTSRTLRSKNTENETEAHVTKNDTKTNNTALQLSPPWTRSRYSIVQTYIFRSSYTAKGRREKKKIRCTHTHTQKDPQIVRSQTVGVGSCQITSCHCRIVESGWFHAEPCSSRPSLWRGLSFIEALGEHCSRRGQNDVCTLRCSDVWCGTEVPVGTLPGQCRGLCPYI